MRDRFDVNVEEVRHPDVFGPRHTFERRNDGRRPCAVQDGAQRQAAGHGVGIGLVVQQDQNAVGVGQIALILLHAGARQRAAEFGEERRFEELGQRQIRNVRKLIANGLGALLASAVPTPST